MTAPDLAAPPVAVPPVATAVAVSVAETRTRSVAKALSWRTIATLITGLLVWRLTGRVEVALALGSLDAALKLAAFYGHERIWQRIKFGTSRSAGS